MRIRLKPKLSRAVLFYALVPLLLFFQHFTLPFLFFSDSPVIHDNMNSGEYIRLD